MQQRRHAKVEMRIVKGRVVCLGSIYIQIIWDSEHGPGIYDVEDSISDSHAGSTRGFAFTTKTYFHEKSRPWRGLALM